MTSLANEVDAVQSELKDNVTGIPDDLSDLKGNVTDVKHQVAAVTLNATV